MDDNKVIYEYLSKHGLQEVAKGILNQVNARIAERIVTTVNSQSDDDHVASAAAVYKAIRDSHHTRIQFVTGDIDVLVPLEDRSPDVLYFQRDTEHDTTWMMYIWDVDNQQWVCVGDTEIDLSGYWSKEETADLAAELGIPGIEAAIQNINGSIAGIEGRLDGIDGQITDINGNIEAIEADIDDINVELEDRVRYEEIAAIPKPTIKEILDDAYDITDPFKYEPVATAAEIATAIEDAIAAGETDVAIRLTENINLNQGGTKTTINVPEGVNLELNIDGVTVSCTDGAFDVKSGATLKLVGDGTLVATTKKSNAAVYVDNGGTVIIDGITIDGTTQGLENNWVYGVYAKNQSRVEFKSGVIKVAGASCISTNNTTGGSDIIVTGGELYSEGCYAIYCPAQGTVDITNAIVQGVHARMGTINIGTGARIIPPAINAENALDPGDAISQSGSVELGDAVVLIAGSYSDPNGINIELNVTDDATIESNFRSAIGVYLFDTKAAANVTVNVANGDNVSTEDPGFDAIKVYDHDYLSAAATAAGKTYNPVATSTVVLNVE